MFEILFSETSEKQFEKLERLAQERILHALERIQIRPESYVKRLVGSQSYRLRVGDYRIILDIVHDKLLIMVIEIGHRSTIYK